MPRKLRDALEIVSDIGSLGFDLQYHDDIQIRHAVAVLRAVNPELFNWLVQALGVDGGSVGDAREESKPATPKNEPHGKPLAGAVSAEPPAWQSIAFALIDDVKLIADYADRNTFYGPADAFRDSIAWAVKHAALLTAELAALRAESRETPNKENS